MVKQLKTMANATSICPACGGHAFEAQAIYVRGLTYRPFALQCAKCGVVLGVVDRYETGVILKVIATHLKALAVRVSNLKKR